MRSERSDQELGHREIARTINVKGLLLEVNAMGSLRMVEVKWCKDLIAIARSAEQLIYRSRLNSFDEAEDHLVKNTFLLFSMSVYSYFVHLKERPLAKHER